LIVDLGREGGREGRRREKGREREKRTTRRIETRKLILFPSFSFLSFLSSPSQGDWLTNMGPTDVNAVTWAVFPGQEIVQSTIIDDVSFLSWKVRFVLFCFPLFPLPLLSPLLSLLFTLLPSFPSFLSKPKTEPLSPLRFPALSLSSPSPSSLSYLLASQEEAFSIWQDWSYLYPAGSPSRKLLQELGDELWLVSVVHHDYKDPEGLGRFLLGE